MGKIKIDINESENLTIITVTGTIAYDDIVQGIEDFYEGKTTPFLIWDASNTDPRHISSQDIEQFVDIVRKYADTRKGGKTAFVSPKDLAFGISRVFTAISEMKNMPIEFRSFRNLDEAKEWFGIK
jgi:hypothetical protein